MPPLPAPAAYDAWCLGVLIFYLLVGSFPFEAPAAAAADAAAADAAASPDSRDAADNAEHHIAEHSQMCISIRLDLGQGCTINITLKRRRGFAVANALRPRRHRKLMRREVFCCKIALRFNLWLFCHQILLGERHAV